MKTEQLLQAITQAQSSFIRDLDTKRVFEDLLEVLLAITDSEYGYIGEVLYKPDGDPFLKTHSITNIAWNMETRRFYEENAPEGLEFYNLDTLFGHVIRHGEVVISNSPSTDPRSGSLPEGHPPLNAYLGLPFFSSGKLVGSAGISNRNGGYDSAMVEFLKPLSATCANIIQANRAATEREAIEKMKSEFISIASHELKTPMTSIKGSLGLLESLNTSNLSTEDKDLLRIANRNADRLIRILNDFLDIDKIESQEFVMNLEKVKISDTIDLSIRELEHELESKNIQLDLSRVDTSLELKADRDRIVQVFVNLLSNATKFSPEGSTITVQMEASEAGTCSISISDQGPGIREENLAKLFNKFFQEDATSTRSKSGSGLGLFIVKTIVEKHGGNISVENDEGAKFSIVLPLTGTAEEVSLEISA